MTRSHAWESAQAAAASIAPESNLFARLDPVGFGAATWAAWADAAAQPERATQAALRFAADMALIAPVAFARSVGMAVEPPLPIDTRDKRFADPAWRDNPVFFAVQQSFAARQRFANELIALCEDEADRAKAELALSLFFDAWAPSNFLATNPAALKRAIDTCGASVARGVSNFVDDLLTNNGRPRQVDARPFHLGQNLAATPGKVVYRGELMELIQYLPQTETVHSVPVLASPPWINKYYIMDLAPGRSFLEWAVQHGRTVFAISYRNPDRTMRDVGLDDYLVQGPRAALDVIEEITGSSVIDVVGLCLGGALTAVAAAYLSRIGDPRIGTLTLLNTLLDYGEPGQLGVFTDPTTVAGLERKMTRAGVLGGEDMAGTFDILRANDLIFNYVVSNWLMGESPPAFDILAWNSDNTRMPAKMHSFYLHSFYLQNQLARGELEIIGERLALADIKKDTYIVSAVNDHIVPWTSSYKSVHLLGGDVRFVLSSGGHIAGIVNPPGVKAWYETAPALPQTAEAWRDRAARSAGSWWEDWTDWSASRAGPMVVPRESAVGAIRQLVTPRANTSAAEFLVLGGWRHPRLMTRRIPWHTVVGMPSGSRTALGEIIRRQRELAALPMRQLAGMVGISGPYLSQIENGLRAPSNAVLEAIANALQTNAEALYAQAGFVTPESERAPTDGESAVLAAIRSDPALTGAQRRALTEIYKSLLIANKVRPDKGR